MKKELIWKSFYEESPTCEWIWKTDGKTVVLEDITNQPIGKGPFLWAEAEIEYPEVPKKTLHRCERQEFEGYNRFTNFCMETESGVLFLHSREINVKLDHRIISVKFCPFCGFSPEKQ